MSRSATSDAMTRQDLSVFLQDWFCGCGNPRDAVATLLKLLEMHPLYEHRAELEALIPTGLEHLVLYTLDHFELTEHGGSVSGAWLTPKGEAVRDALRREWPDEFEALLEGRCIHGWSHEHDEGEHNCMGAPEPVQWNAQGPVVDA